MDSAAFFFNLSRHVAVLLRAFLNFIHSRPDSSEVKIIISEPECGNIFGFRQALFS